MVAFARGCTRIAAVVARYCWRKARYRRERRAGLVWPCPFDDVSRRRTVCTFCDKAARLRVSSSLFAVPRRLNADNLLVHAISCNFFASFLCLSGISGSSAWRNGQKLESFDNWQLNERGTRYYEYRLIYRLTPFSQSLHLFTESNTSERKRNSLV